MLNKVLDSLRAGNSEYHESLGIISPDDVNTAIAQLESLKTRNIPNLMNLILARHDDHFAARFFINIENDNPTRVTFVESSSENLAKMYNLTQISKAIDEYKKKQAPQTCTALTEIEDLTKLLANCTHNCNVTINSTTIVIPASVLRAALVSNQSASQHTK